MSPHPCPALLIPDGRWLPGLLINTHCQGPSWGHRRCHLLLLPLPPTSSFYLSQGSHLGLASSRMSRRKMPPPSWDPIASWACFCPLPLAPGPSRNALSLWVLSLRASGRPGYSSFFLSTFLDILGGVPSSLHQPLCLPWPAGP